MDCDHSGTHSGAARYIRESGQLRLVLVCDQCGTERGELGRVEHRIEARFSATELPQLTAPSVVVARVEL